MSDTVFRDHDNISPMLEPKDRFPEQLAIVVNELFTRGHEEARRALEPIGMEHVDVPRRTEIPKTTIAQVFVRDHFICRYCGGKTIPPPVLRVLSSAFPDLFPYHKNWRADSTHPAYLSRSSCCDHIHPGARPGSWNQFKNPWTDLDNVVTACWSCNASKADLTLDQLGWALAPVSRCGWDGLTFRYEELWNATGRPNARYHRSWISAFKRATSLKR
jgi:hypothetical protein